MVYPLSTGPVVWLASRGYLPERVYENFASPFVMALEFFGPCVPEPLKMPVYYATYGYIQLWLPPLEIPQ